MRGDHRPERAEAARRRGVQALHEHGSVAAALPAVGGEAVVGAVGVHVLAAHPPLGERDVPGDRAAVAGRLVRAADDAGHVGGVGGFRATYMWLLAGCGDDGGVGRHQVAQ